MAGFSVIRVGLAWALSLGLAAAELSSVAEVRALSRAETAQALPVRLRGVVIWQDADTRPAFFLHVTEPPPPDLFSAPRVPLDRLLPFNPDTKPFHRKVTSGVVTLSVPGKFFFIQEGERGVRGQSASGEVMPGDLVDVAGFIDTSQTIASLNGALVRRTGRTDTAAHRMRTFTSSRIANHPPSR